MFGKLQLLFSKLDFSNSWAKRNAIWHCW